MLVIYSFSTTFYFSFLFVKYPPPAILEIVFPLAKEKKTTTFLVDDPFDGSIPGAIPRITKRGFDHFGNLFFVIVYSVDLVGLFGPARPNHRRGRPGARAVQDGTGCRHA